MITKFSEWNDESQMFVKNSNDLSIDCNDYVFSTILGHIIGEQTVIDRIDMEVYNTNK